MSLEEFDAARQLLAEETVGRLLRQVQDEEDRLFNDTYRRVAQGE